MRDLKAVAPGEMTNTPRQRHPRGLFRLFFTEMWERFSFYGMRALLVLFMVDSIKKGGMGLDDKSATAIYGIYTGLVYLAALPGGWVADRFLGARQAVWYGGLVIAAGHFVLALPWTQTFYIGLGLVVVGTGLLKPNVSAMVGQLYSSDDARRDAGFTIFYMGINLGATLGPLVCSGLGENINWHYGFLAAGVGMVAGLIQYRLAVTQLSHVGLPPERASGDDGRVRMGFVLLAVIILILGVLAEAGVIHIDPVAIARVLSSAIAFLGLFYFAWIFAFGGLSPSEKKRVGLILILFLTSALFWAGFEQAGSSFNLFAERYTRREVNWPGLAVVPAGWYQSLGPVFVILLAPVMAALWLKLGRANREPSIPVKFGWALLLLALGFLVMAGAAQVVSSGVKVGAGWLVSTYLLHTIGELCLSPVGLSSVTKLAPARLVGGMMGAWFLATSLGNVIAGQMAGLLGDETSRMAGRYLAFASAPALIGVALLLCAPRIRRWVEA